MTTAHILYIPTIFLLGFLTGSLFGKAFTHSNNNPSTESRVTSKALLGSFLIFVAVFIGTHFFEIPRSSKAVTQALNGLEIFDKKPSYTSSEVYSRIEMFPENGRLLYQQFTYTIDILFPVTLFVFLLLLSRYVIKKNIIPKWSQIVLMALPVFWLSLDFIENAIIFNLLKHYPVRHHVLAGCLGFITIAKFSLLLLSILAPAVMITLINLRRGVAANNIFRNS